MTSQPAEPRPQRLQARVRLLADSTTGRRSQGTWGPGCGCVRISLWVAFSLSDVLANLAGALEHDEYVHVVIPALTVDDPKMLIVRARFAHQIESIAIKLSNPASSDHHTQLVKVRQLLREHNPRIARPALNIQSKYEWALQGEGSGVRLPP